MVLQSWYVFFDISFFKYNTDGIWVWKVRPGANTNTNIYSLFPHCNSLFLLSFYHYVNLIAFKKQNKKPKKLTCSKYKHHIEWAFKTNMLYILFSKFCPLTNLSLHVPININHFFICPNSKSQQSVVRKLRLTLPEGVIRISLARMLEYCALNLRCSISCFQTSPSRD